MSLKEYLIHTVKEGLPLYFPDMQEIMENENAVITSINVTIQRKISKASYGFRFGKLGHKIVAENKIDIPEEVYLKKEKMAFDEFLMKWNESIDNLIDSLYLSPVFSEATIEGTEFSMNSKINLDATEEPLETSLTITIIIS